MALRNPGLQQFKSLLNLKLEARGATMAGRAACAATLPNQLRIEWLNMMGLPVASLAADGQTLAIRTYNDNSIHHWRQSQTVLDRVIHIPMGVNDLVALLAGRVVVPPYAAAQEEPAEGNEKILVLKNRWKVTLARFWLNGSGQPDRQETYETDGTLRYRIVWLSWKQSGPFTVPHKVLVEAGTGETLMVAVERFWPNVQLSPETFVLHDPAESGM